MSCPILLDKRIGVLEKKTIRDIIYNDDIYITDGKLRLFIIARRTLK